VIERQQILIDQRLLILRKKLEIASNLINHRAKVLYRIKELESIALIFQQAEEELELIKDLIETIPEEIIISGNPDNFQANRRTNVFQLPRHIVKKEKVSRLTQDIIDKNEVSEGLKK
jgi:hypothetical protein